MNGKQGGSGEARSLGNYIEVVWRFKLPILIIAIVVGLVAARVSTMGLPVYESIVTFTATQSKLGDGGQITANTAAFRPMVENLTTAAAVVKEMGLGNPPYNMRPSDFLDAMTVTEVRGTSLITVKVAMTDAELASRVANNVAAHAVQSARRVSAGEAAYSRDLVKEQLDEARAHLDEAQRSLREYRQQARVEAIKKEVEVRLGIGSAMAFMEDPSRGRGLLDVLLKIAGEKAKLTSAERDLAARRPASAADPVSQGLETVAAAARSSLAALQQQQAELLRAHPLDAGTISVLDRLYAAETEIARREAERLLSEKIYAELAQKYQDARLQVIGKSAEFVVIDPAVPSDRPMPRHIARNIVLSIAIWLCFAVAGVWLWESAPRRRLAA